MLMIKKLIFGLMLFPLLASASTLSVSKPRILLDGKHNKDEFRIFNPTTEFQTYRVEFVDMEMDEEGNIKQVESYANSAKSFLRVGPRMGKNIGPEQFQSFRVMLRRSGLKDGEYRSHILMESLLPPMEAAEGVTVRPNIKYSVPVIVRYGELNAKISIDNVSISKNSEGVNELSLNINREGNRSIYGTLKLTAPDVSEPLFEARGLAVYTELNSRHVKFPINKEIPQSGVLLLEFVEDPAYGGTESVQLSVPLDPLM